MHLKKYIYTKLYKSSNNRACLSRAEDPIAQLDPVHDLVKDVAEDVTEGISMLMAVIAEIPALSLVLVVEEPRPLRPDGEGGEVGQQRVEPPEPHLAHELKVAANSIRSSCSSTGSAN